ncbi:uncharacterized protein LOC135699037 [Ochlerotatus camptorhynchus]|uniref:uncharacterized protein LOC135699037 n=1 Tax=Ochlerotatus camptorhynchus TaxID=644619 RepID=UPI0031CFD6E0
MEVKKVRVTNRKQFEMLVSMLEEHPPVAKGQKFCEVMHISKQNYTEIWDGIRKKLNSLGPPMRTVEGWQKVWSDYRQNVKHKLAYNKKESQATGGGRNKMNVLSSCEEAVVKLLALDRTVNHSGSVFGIPQDEPSSHRSSHVSPSFRELLSSTPQQAMLPIPESPILNEDDQESENIENINTTNRIDRNGNIQLANKSHKRKKEEEETKMGMLRKQTECMKTMADDARETARYTRKIYKLKEEHYKRKQEHMLAKEKQKSEELQFKMQLLKYKKRKLEFLERTA